MKRFLSLFLTALMIISAFPLSIFASSEAGLIESAHPYPNNCNETKIIYEEGALWIKVTFSDDTYTENKFDFIYIYDGQDKQVGCYTASDLSGKSISVNGDTVKIILTSDGGVSYYGYKVISVVPFYEECTHSNTEIRNAYEPECTSYGYTGDIYCTDCEQLITCGESIPSLGHIFEGLSCTRCGESVFSYSYIYDGDHNVTGLVISGYNGTESELVIPAKIEGYPVIGIADYAFSDNSFLTSVKVYEGITSIGYNAFCDCQHLESIELPDSITSMGGDAFYNTAYYNDDSNWEDGVLYISRHLIRADTSFSGEYAVREGTVTIAGSAFGSCASLTSITIPDGLRGIGRYAFRYCSALAGINIPDSVISIETEAFFQTAYSNNEDNWENGALYISNYLIASNSLMPAEYDIREGTRVIAENAFSWNNSIESITIPDSVISIGNCAFYNCYSLESITIGAGVTSIGDHAFYSCSSLSSVEYTGTPFQWMNISIGSDNYYLTNLIDYEYGSCGDGVSYVFDLTTGTLTISGTGAMENWDWSRNVPWYSSRSEIKSVIIEEGVTSIGDYAFYACSNLSSITIGDSVESIGLYAFYNCASLSSITISGGVTSIGGSAFYNCPSLTSVTIGDSVKSIGRYAFYYCTVLTSVIIGDGVEYIGENAFCECYSLTNLTIGNNVKNIENGAFDYCTSLANVTIPNSVTRIGNYAFSESALTSITIPDSVTSIGSYAFYFCSSLASINGANNVTELGMFAFYGTAYYRDMSNREDGALYIGKHLIKVSVSLEGSYSVREGTLSVSGSAFEDCKKITSIEIPGSVTSISYAAFANCTALSEIELPDGLTSIGSSAFYNCTALTSINIPSGVTSIGWYAFNGCSALEATHITDIAAWCNIYFDGADANPVHISNDLYLNGELVEELIIPGSVSHISYNAFENCTSLTSVDIPESVTGIGGNAFEGCTSLTGFNVAEANPAYASVDGVLYNKNITALWGYPAGKPDAEYTLPDSVTEVNCRFNYAANLSAVNAGTANSQYASIDGVLYNKDITRIVAYPPAKTATIYMMPDTVKSLGSGISNAYIESIVLSDSITELYSSFEGCPNLKNVCFGSSFRYFTRYAFSDLTSVESYEVAGDNPYFSSIDGILLSKDGTRLEACPTGYSPSCTVPDSVTSISYCAFMNCKNLKSVDIPSTVKSISVSAFIANPSLEEINVIGEGGKYTSVDGTLYEGEDSIIKVPDAVTDYVIPGGVRQIAYYSFYKCEDLKTITIPTSVVSIGEYAFKECNSLETVYYEGSENEWADIYIDVWGNIPLENADIVFNYIAPDKYVEAENGVSLDKYNGSEAEATIPSEYEGKPVVAIGEKAFKNKSDITSITIPESVTEIAEGAFDGCTSLEEIIYEGEMLPCPIDEAELPEAANEGFSGNGRIEVGFEDSTDETVVFEFTAEKTGSHYMFTDGTSLDAVWVYGEDGALLSYGDSLDGSSELKLHIDCVSGKAYYIVIRCINPGTTGARSVSAPAKVPTQFVINYTSDVCGDASADGKVTVADVLRIRKLIAGIEGEDNLSILASDVDGNGIFTLSDVLLIRKYIAGIITEFPAEK